MIYNKIVGYSIDSTIIGVDTSDAMFSIVSPVSLGNFDGLMASEYNLFQNYPNPFNPKTVISWQSEVGSDVELSVYNLLGQKVAILVSGKQKAGYHEVEFNGQNLSSGVYLYKICAGGWQAVRKMILLR